MAPSLARATRVNMVAQATALEVPQAFIRLSLGIETAADLIEDLRQALDRA